MIRVSVDIFIQIFTVHLLGCEINRFYRIRFISLSDYETKFYVYDFVTF